MRKFKRNIPLASGKTTPQVIKVKYEKQSL